MSNPKAVLTMSSGGEITLELYPQKAPNSVASFLWVASQGLYNGRRVERVVKDYLVQPSYNGFDHDSACEFFIAGEFAANGFFTNDLPFEKWTVGLAGDGASFSSGSEFFLLTGDYRDKLDGRFTAIGRVVDGFDELERLQGVPTQSVEILEDAVVRRPITPEWICSVRVENGGAPCPKPVMLPNSIHP